MGKKKLSYPKRGSLVYVDWADIQENPTGNTDSAEPALRRTAGFFVARKRIKGVWCVVTTTTLEHDEESGEFAVCLDGQSGWAAYPVGAVLKLTAIEERGGSMSPLIVQVAYDEAAGSINVGTNQEGISPDKLAGVLERAKLIILSQPPKDHGSRLVGVEGPQALALADQAKRGGR